MGGPFRWGGPASLAGKREAQGAWGHPQPGKVRPLDEIPIATSCQRPTVTHSDTWPEEAPQSRGGHCMGSTQAFLSDTELIPGPLWDSASHL